MTVILQMAVCKMQSYQYMTSHYKDKMVMILNTGIPIPDEDALLH